MRIAVGTDHGGFHLKGGLIRKLSAEGHRVLDVGTDSPEPCDYPWIGAKVASMVSQRQVHRGLLLCKSGAGMAIVANRFPGVRAAVCRDAASARHARQHNDINVLVLAAEGMQLAQARGIVSAWLNTPFDGGRHARRLRQIQRIERKILSGQCSNTSKR
jgi:ribose 5-phosphate isomerase B